MQPPEPLGELMERWVVDFFNRHDASAGRELMAADYELRVGDLVISGRDEQYLPAVQRQFDQFPDLTMTVHDVIVSGDQAAVYFSEHGTSGGPGGPIACWSGIALYSSDGVRLTGCVVVEDYHARRRQLKSGVADPVAAPMAAPWSVVSAVPDVDAESLVRRWLVAPWSVPAAHVVYDDDWVVTCPPVMFQPTGTHVTDMFSAGSRVAFHVRQTGRVGEPGGGGLGVLCSAGLVDVDVDADADADVVVRGRIMRDRIGLQCSIERT